MISTWTRRAGTAMSRFGSRRSTLRIGRIDISKENSGKKELGSSRVGMGDWGGCEVVCLGETFLYFSHQYNIKHIERWPCRTCPNKIDTPGL